MTLKTREFHDLRTFVTIFFSRDVRTFFAISWLEKLSPPILPLFEGMRLPCAFAPNLYYIYSTEDFTQCAQGSRHKVEDSGPRHSCCVLLVDLKAEVSLQVVKIPNTSNPFRYAGANLPAGCNTNTAEPSKDIIFCMFSPVLMSLAKSNKKAKVFSLVTGSTQFGIFSKTRGLWSNSSSLGCWARAWGTFTRGKVGATLVGLTQPLPKRDLGLSLTLREWTAVLVFEFSSKDSLPDHLFSISMSSSQPNPFL